MRTCLKLELLPLLARNRHKILPSAVGPRSRVVGQQGSAHVGLVFLITPASNPYASASDARIAAWRYRQNLWLGRPWYSLLRQCDRFARFCTIDYCDTLVGVKRRVKVFFDGGCRPNPGPMEAAVVVRGRPQFFDDLGTGSNTDAEWHALLRAIVVAREMGLNDVTFVGDSLEVVRRASLAASTGRALSSHEVALLSLLAQHGRATIRWIKREQNLAGIALEKRRAR